MENKDKEVDVVVIGGGISGIATAKCMQEAGFTVILLERSGVFLRTTELTRVL